MKKGIGALEIIFGMFVLIIVVLVLIRMFTAIVTPKKITEQLEGFESAYQVTAQKAACNQACDAYLDGGCNRRDAVDYCLKKVKIDIDGNKLPGERYHGNFVRNLPYCEDGLYCFHVSDCSCGNYKLTAENCIKILCDYYQLDEGLDDVTAVSLIKNENNGIYWGTCDKDPKDWDLGYNPPSNLQADWWWINAGYDSPSCSSIGTGGGTTFSCSSPSTGAAQCQWSGCETGSGKLLSVTLRKGTDPSVSCILDTDNTQASGNCQVSGLSSGSYQATLVCSGIVKQISVTVS